MVRLGVVGAGGAFALMSPKIAVHPEVELAAVYDSSPEKATSLFGDSPVRIHETLEAMCGDADVDALYVATPHALHAEQTCLGLKAGKSVLVEKPMAVTLDECDAMIAASDASGAPLIVGPSHAFDPQIMMMSEMIGSGEFGALKMVTMANFTDFLYRPRRPEELSTAHGGGAVLNQLPHHIDILRALDPGSTVSTVTAGAGTWDESRPVIGAYTAFVEMAGGCVASITYSGYAHFLSDELQGWWREQGDVAPPPSYGTARQALRGLTGVEESQLKDARATSVANSRLRPHLPHFGLVIASCERADLLPVPDGVAVFGDYEHREHHIADRSGAAVLDELVAATKRSAAPRHDGRWGRATLEACLAVEVSAREKRTVALR